MLCKGIVKDNLVTLPADVALPDETEVTIVIPAGGPEDIALGEGKPKAMDVFQLNSGAEVWKVSEFEFGLCFGIRYWKRRGDRWLKP